MKDISIPKVITGIIMFILTCTLTGTILGFIGGIAYIIFNKMI